MKGIKFLRYLPHYLRKKFKEKIIVIESDDWGLERAMNIDSINFLKKKYSEEKFTRWTFDALETNEDIELLYEVLGSFKSNFEYPPVITANFVTHNVDYDSSDDLKFIPISKGFNKDSEDVRELYKCGIENNFIYPQLHGFSHYNLSELTKYFYTKEGQEAFENSFFTGSTTIKGNLKFLTGELCFMNKDTKIKESIDELCKIFNVESETIIPPNYILSKQNIDDLKNNGIKMIQSSNRLVQSDGSRYSFPYFRIRNGLVWSVRNARLDPHIDYGFYHDECINDIGKAFDNKLPAIIDFHRVNFSGKFTPLYRDKTLSEMKKLFECVYKKWPDVKFLNSSDLNKLIWQQETR
ncbi:MAG TPA: hypothetical protein PLX80_04740 [Ignavibacteria bacterium]|nr:hypothetical protein [Ignavibacteria bacterium]